MYEFTVDQRDPDNFLPPNLVTKAEALRKESQNEIQQVLTPEEREQFELRFSSTADVLRNQLTGFDPSEDEFRRIFALRKAMEDQTANSPTGSPDNQRSAATDEARLDEQIKGILSPDRYAQYRMSQDPAYLETLSFARAWDLPQDVTAAVYGIRQAAEKQVQTVTAGSDDEQATVLSAIRAETQNSLRDILGDKTYNSYKRNQSWLKTLGKR